MGGDHKCPVCQATFTRPQHVARHMRSHTGDRPYKCQYCGDQFARSDLLSRHVNKCHANEKPLATIGTRRKGSASASRATTSKQACDQCVQSSLPCDGCNPCSKCVQRKCRCTYVKFHRQTAPVGPGHNNPSASNSSTASASGMVPLPSSSSSRLPPFPHQPEDDFILGPPPSAMSVSSSSGGGLPTMAETLYNSNTFSFPALYPSATSSSATGLDADAYRAQAQAELFGSGRTSLAPLYDPVPRGTSASSSGTAPGSAGTGASSSWLGWGQQQQSHHQGSHSNDTYHHQSQHQHRINAHNLLPSISGGGPHPSTTGASAMHDKFQPLQEHQQQYMNMPYPVSVPASYLPHAVGSRPGTGNSNSGSVPDAAAMDIGRRGSIDTNVSVDALDPYGGAGSDGSHSVPSSAASSNVHLPLGMIHGFNAGYNLALGVPDRASTASTSTTSSSSSHHHHARGDSDSSYAGGPGGTGGGYVAPDERQEFSSAFGLMSLDDPNVLAGLAVDGQPFFSDPNQAHNQQGQEERRGDDQDHQHESKANDNAILGTDMDTPMPIKRSSGLLSGDLYLGGSLKGPGANTLPTPSREMDAREMREFWKQYMRTPLSGPGDANGNATPSGPAPNANANINKGSQGSTSFRRQRVSSLPSVKTPIIEYDQMYGAHDQYYHHHHHHHGGHQQQQPGGDAKLGPMSSIRTTLHGNAEDLRSYEAAVLAREAPALMNLQLKRPAKKTGGNGGQSRDNGKSNNPKNAIALDVHPKKEPSSPALSQNQTHSLGTPSTLANALSPSKEEGASPALSSSSTHSHSREPSSAHDESDTELRPSFKRLPSQTLGPANAKRTFYGFNDEDENRELVGWGSGTSEGPASGPRNLNNAGGSTAGGSIDVSHADRVVASLAERRRRRMSAPGASLNLQSLPSPFPTTAVDRDNKNGEGSYISHVPVAAYARGRPVGK